MPEKWRKPVISGSICLLFCLLCAACGSRETSIVPVQQTQAQQSASHTEPEPEKDSGDSGPQNETAAAEAKAQTESVHNIETIIVHVAGAVESPGIYELEAGSRLWQAVEAAGGVTEDGAQDYLNMAAVVSDGEKVVVPFLDQVDTPWGQAQTPTPGTETGQSPENGRVNLNTASLEQLMTLPGIGEAKARAILSYRDSAGGFQSPEEIMNVPGIKEGAYAKIKDEITVSDE